MLKKSLSMLMVLAMSIMVAACSSTPPPTNTNGGGTKSASTDKNGSSLRYAETQMIRMLTSAPGGGMYNIAAAISPIWQEKLNVTASIGPGGSYSNFLAVSKGETDIGFCHQCMHYWAERGEGPFQSKITGLSTLTTLFPATVQVFTSAKNTSIKTVADVKDKRIGLGPQGSALNIFVLDYLNKMYGITLDKIAEAGGSVNYMSDSDISSGISDGIIDVGFALGTYPKSSIQEIENTPGIRLIPFGDDLQKYLATNPGWNKMVIPAKTYAGQDKDYPTATSWAVATVSNKMDE